jgi:hypothetical protein
MIEKDSSNVGGSKSFFMLDIMKMYDQTQQVHFILDKEGNPVGIIGKNCGKSFFKKDTNEKTNN